jgi:hypothetical protein
MDPFYEIFCLFFCFIILFVAAVIWSSWKQFQANKEVVALYDSLPDIMSYVKLQPQARTPTGPRCHKCESNHLANFAVHNGSFWGNRVSKENFLGRIHFCKRCDTRLYRTAGNDL